LDEEEEEEDKRGSDKKEEEMNGLKSKAYLKNESKKYNRSFYNIKGLTNELWLLITSQNKLMCLEARWPHPPPI